MLINVRAHGAVGDGVTNDSPAFVTAFAVAMATHGAVYVPPGKYRLASIINVANGGADVDLRMVGDGRSSIILPDCAGLLYCIGFTNIRTVEVGNLRFNGAGRQGARSVDNFVLQFFNSNGWVHDVRFENLVTLKSVSSAYEGIISNYGGASGGRLRLDRVRIAASCDVGTANDHSYICNLPQSGFGFRGFEAFDCWMQEIFTPTETAAHVVFFGDPVMHGINDDDAKGAGAYNSLIPLDYDVNAATGAYVSPHRYVYDGDVIRMVNVRMCGQVKSGHLKFSPTTGRYQWIYLDGVQFGSSDFDASPNLDIKQADLVEITRTWMGIGGAFRMSPAINLVDAGNVVIAHSRFEGDDLYRPPNTGHARIVADAATKSLRLRDVFYKEIVSACPTIIEQDGFRGRLRGTTASEIPANVLVKINSDGQVAALGTTDAAINAIGVSLGATRRAYGYVIFDSNFNITEGDTFAIDDGINTPMQFTFTLSGQSYAGRVVSVNNGMTADQRAQAFAEEVAAAHGTVFQVTAAVIGGGTGRVKLTNDNIGYVGNRTATVWDGNTVAGKQSVVAGAIVVLGLGEGVQNVPVSERGQEVPVKNDGAFALVPGDIVSPSTTQAGRVTKLATDPVGVVVIGCAATLDAVARVALR